MYGFLELLKEKKLNEFNYDLLKEGLISSVSYDVFINKTKKHDINGICDLYTGKDRIIIQIKDDNIYKRKFFYDDFSNLLNQLGYYVSNYKIDKKLVNSNANLSIFLKNENLLLYLNKKFDSETGYVPEILYHVTENDFIEKIKKNGIINKSKKFIENHPERIYLFITIDDCHNYADQKNLSDYIILKIDSKTLNNIKLYNDPKYQPTIEAYYTYDNIPPYSIEILK